MARDCKKVEAVGVDGLELNFGCPHGMAERGMGSASGQVPALVEKQTYWVKEVAKTPVIVKLTPNITDITATAEAAVKGGADAVSMINTINSLAGLILILGTPFHMLPGKARMGDIVDQRLNRLHYIWLESVPEIQGLISRYLELVESLTGKMQSNSC